MTLTLPPPKSTSKNQCMYYDFFCDVCIVINGTDVGYEVAMFPLVKIYEPGIEWSKIWLPFNLSYSHSYSVAGPCALSAASSSALFAICARISGLSANSINRRRRA